MRARRASRRRAILLIFTERRIRLPFLGYLGHMWELYAMWSWAAAIASASYATSLASAQAVQLGKLTAALAIALGGLACVPAGLFGDRIGKAEVTIVAMVASGLGALLTAASFRRPGLADLRADHSVGHRDRPQLGAVLGADRRRLAAASGRQPAHLPDRDRLCADHLHGAGHARGRQRGSAGRCCFVFWPSARRSASRPCGVCGARRRSFSRSSPGRRAFFTVSCAPGR